MGGLLDQEPAGVGVAAFGDASLPLFAPAGVFRGHEAEDCHELLGVFETAERADLRDGDHGGDELEALEGHECVDEGFALPAAEEVEHLGLDAFDSFLMEVDEGEVVLEDDVVGTVGHLKAAQVVHVRLAPVGLAVVLVAEAAE